MKQSKPTALEAKLLPISELHSDPANARNHSERNIEAIKASLAKFGQRKPIVVQKSGMVVRAGNGTLAAAKALGWEAIAAVVVDDDDATAVQFAIADNRTAELAEWNYDALSQILHGMSDQEKQQVGFSQEDMDKLEAILNPKEAEGDGASSVYEVKYQVVVDVKDADQQAQLIAQLEQEGFTCQAFMS